MGNQHIKFWPKHLPTALSVPETSIFTNLRISAERYPKKDCIIFYDTRITYAKLLSEAETVASYLWDNCGVEKGDRVILDLQNSPQFIISFYAILMIGAVVVPVNPMSVTQELEHYSTNSDAKIAITGQESLAKFEPILGKSLKKLIVATYSDYLKVPSDVDAPDFITDPRKKLKLVNTEAWGNIISLSVKPKHVEVSSSDLAAILYTSGTTGKPKGCVHTHQSFMQSLVGAVLWESMNQDSVSLGSAPMFHVTGMQHTMNAAIYSSSKIVLLPRWSPDTAGYLIETHKCTHWANVPTMVVDLLAHPSTKARDLSSLQLIFGGGSSMPEQVAEDLYQRCGIKYMEGYGLTETVSQTHMNPAGNLRKQCLGIPTFGTESIILDPDKLVELTNNERGEILVAGPQLMKGYWKNPKANSKIFIEINGTMFLRTGDLGYVDSDGFFYIADRLKRMINAAGFKVWPAEVEAVLYRHPKIKEVAIISSPHKRKGETVKAVISLKKQAETITEDEVIEWSRKQMAAYKIPRAVTFVNSLPKTGSGKIQWRSLQEKEWEEKT